MMNSNLLNTLYMMVNQLMMNIYQVDNSYKKKILLMNMFQQDKLNKLMFHQLNNNQLNIVYRFHSNNHNQLYMNYIFQL